MKSFDLESQKLVLTRKKRVDWNDTGVSRGGAYLASSSPGDWAAFSLALKMHNLPITSFLSMAKKFAIEAEHDAQKKICKLPKEVTREWIFNTFSKISQDLGGLWVRLKMRLKAQIPYFIIMKQLGSQSCNLTQYQWKRWQHRFVGFLEKLEPRCALHRALK